MEIFHISAECYPVAKVGGLDDGGALQNIKIMQDICKSRVPCYDTNSGRIMILMCSLGM
jgi:hypothetical protein